MGRLSSNLFLLMLILFITGSTADADFLFCSWGGSRAEVALIDTRKRTHIRRFENSSRFYSAVDPRPRMIPASTSLACPGKPQKATVVGQKGNGRLFLGLPGQATSFERAQTVLLALDRHRIPLF
jgi:hypothetical protein